MQSVALGYHVYDTSGRAIDLAMIGLCMFLPVALLSLYAGGLADRVDRRRLVSACLLANALLSLVLVAVALAAPDRVWPIYGVALGLGTVKAFAAPAGKAILPSLVPPAELAQAVAWSSGLFQVATIAGPALGGIALAFGPPALVYGIAAGLGLVASAISTRVVVRPLAVAQPSAAGVLSGVRFVLGQPILFGAITLDLGAVLLGGTTALLPIVQRDILHVGPWALGLLRAAPAVGAALMAVWLAHFPIARRAGRRLFVAVALFGVATIGFGLSRELWLSLLCLATLGAADMVSVVIRSVLVQLATPEDMRGRVSAVSSLFIVASNELGEFESGLAAALLGTSAAIVVGGALSLAVVAICAVAFPALRDADRLAGQASA